MEEEGGGDLWSGYYISVFMLRREGIGILHFSHDFGAFFRFLAFDFTFLCVLLETSIVLAEDSFYLGAVRCGGVEHWRGMPYSAELAGFLCGTHLVPYL